MGLVYAMTQQKRLGLVLGINLVMIAGLVIVGLASHSLGVLAAGGDFAADRRTRAEAMIQALRFRGQTLLRIGQAIADHQHRFFALGPDHLAPMSRRDLAAKLGLHASTIGRAVSSKAIEVSGRLYPLSLFFSTHLPVEGGLGVAAFVVQRRIAQLIEQEPVHAPLSDDAICAALRATGVDIARRTVFGLGLSWCEIAG